MALFHLLYKTLSSFLDIVYKKTILVLTILCAIGIAAILWHQSHLETELVEATAVQNAARYVEALEEFRTLYTSEVVETVRRLGVEDATGSLPLRAAHNPCDVT